MALAENMEKDITSQNRVPAEISTTKSNGVQKSTGSPTETTLRKNKLCPVCHVNEKTPQTTLRCTNCDRYTCEKCGHLLHEGDSQGQDWICVDCIRCSPRSTVKGPENSNSKTSRDSEDENTQPDTPTGSSQVQQSFEQLTESSNIYESYNSVAEYSKQQQFFKLEIDLPVTQEPVVDNIVKPHRDQQPSLTSDPESSSVHWHLQEHGANTSARDHPVEDNEDERGHLPGALHETDEKMEGEEKESDENTDVCIVLHPFVNRNLGCGLAIFDEEGETSSAQFQLAGQALNSDNAPTLIQWGDVEQTHCKTHGSNVQETSSISGEKIDKPFTCVDTEEPLHINGDVEPLNGDDQQQNVKKK
ncbi:uncharacterized protein LOC143237704 isoform X2 [Tachypleus tridentatus]|uniref:uncharacterized protein LOC143237704 isoform X2 n=1 Tax=Tachypleus tridentatus TaxID=6853 RepID=UPI003FD086CF